jgi:hypothetical protein
MKTVTITLTDDQILENARLRANSAGLSVDEFVSREIRRVIRAARESDELPPMTQSFSGIAPMMSDAEFREFRRGYLTRKYE